MTLTETKPVSMSIPLTSLERKALDDFSNITGYKKGAWVKKLIVDALKNDGYLPKEEDAK